MLRRRINRTTSEKYNWIDLKCPSCGSYNCIKVEDKNPCDNPKCRQYKEYCSLHPCSNSVEFISNLGTIQQRFLCRSCGHRFMEIRRVL